MVGMAVVMVMVVVVVMVVVMLVLMLMLMMVVMMVVVMVVVAVMGLVMGCLVAMVMNSLAAGAQGHIVAVFLLVVDGDVHVGSCDAAGDSLAGLNFHAGKQVIHGLQKVSLFFCSHQFVQCRHQHIASSAHVAFQV